MISLWISILASQLAGDASPLLLTGRCNYPPNLPALQLGEVRFLCDSVAVRREGAEDVIEFRRKSWGRWLRFSGEVAGSRMAIRQVHLSREDVVEARGTCEIFYNGGRVSAVSCVAQAGWRSYVANFTPSRL
jgi:hypothetical protein